MTVDAMQHDIAVIDVKQTVANVDIAESDALRHNLKDVAAGIFRSSPDDRDTAIPPTTAVVR